MADVKRQSEDPTNTAGKFVTGFH